MQTPTNSNKNAGGDHVKAKQIKCGTENIAKEIATINDEIARTGMHPIKWYKIDMSIAFDTLDRTILWKKLKTIFDPDELHQI